MCDGHLHRRWGLGIVLWHCQQTKEQSRAGSNCSDTPNLEAKISGKRDDVYCLLQPPGACSSWCFTLRSFRSLYNYKQFSLTSSFQFQRPHHCFCLCVQILSGWYLLNQSIFCNQTFVVRQKDMLKDWFSILMVKGTERAHKIKIWLSCISSEVLDLSQPNLG